MFGRRRWEPATATIVSRRVVREGADGRSGTEEWVADVAPGTATPFRTVIKMPPDLLGNFWGPSIGDVVRVLWDPKDNHVKFDESDPQLSFKEYRKRQKEQQDAELAAPPGTPAGGSTS